MDYWTAEEDDVPPANPNLQLKMDLGPCQPEPLALSNRQPPGKHPRGRACHVYGFRTGILSLMVKRCTSMRTQHLIFPYLPKNGCLHAGPFEKFALSKAGTTDKVGTCLHGFWTSCSSAVKIPHIRYHGRLLQAVEHHLLHNSSSRRLRR